MSKYLVECHCGKKLPVELGQAGGQVACSCGNQVDVPPLRKLRHLPPAEEKIERPAAPSWNARKGVITACLLFAGVLALINAWSWFTQPKVPVFDPEVYQHNVVEHRLQAMTPSDGWNWWVSYYKPLAERGFSNLEFADRARIEATIAERSSLRRTLWVLAATAVGIAAAAAVWPKPPATS